MITLAQGNLLDAEADAIVNTVNTVGVMGKGIALQFKQAYPDNFKAYKRACDRGDVQVGHMFIFDTGRLSTTRYIVNFPTKRHWRMKSRLSDIEAGLKDLKSQIVAHNITSIAIPPLGCGNGGLDWSDVEPLIREHLSDLVDVNVLLYPPAGAPPPSAMPVGTKRPTMTLGRAALIMLLDRYLALTRVEQMSTASGISLLEIQKLMYLLQESGQPLRLNYTKGHYGPYAENLNHVLQLMEGHQLRGYGDRTQQVLALEPIEIQADALAESQSWLEVNGADVRPRIESVLRLSNGFASPYGLELLATVHWIALRELSGARTTTAITNQVASWNSRKGRIFTPTHVERALSHLESQGWLTTPAHAAHGVDAP